MVDKAESDKDVGNQSSSKKAATGLNVVDQAAMSSGGHSIQRDESRSVLTRSNIGANSMQKLTGAASRAQLIPQADLQNEIQVSRLVILHDAELNIFNCFRRRTQTSAKFRIFCSNEKIPLNQYNAASLP